MLPPPTKGFSKMIILIDLSSPADEISKPLVSCFEGIYQEQ